MIIKFLSILYFYTMKKLLLSFFIFASINLTAQKTSAFRVVPLGVKGGIDESNLSSYMVAPAGTNNYVCLDAGTVHIGIERAIASKAFSVTAEEVLKNYIISS